MNLIFIYGPPACGKLTIATELAVITGYKLFHNHLTQDLAGSIYTELNDLRYKLVEKLRLDVFEYAAENNTNLIYTQFYTGDEDDIHFVEDTKKIVSENNGSIYFIEVIAPLAILQERVINESRKKFGKAQDVESLTKYLGTLKGNPVINHENSLVIDSSLQDASDSAAKIKQAFNFE